MARGPMAAPAAQEDDAHGEIQDDLETGGGGPEGQDGADETEDAALDTGEEQEAGGSEDVEAEPPSRGETRFQRLANENQELKRRLTDLERRPAPTVPQTQQEETEEQFQARTAHLMPDERMEQRQLRSERRFARQLAFTEMRSQDMADKASYDAKATIDTRYQRYATEVETKRNELLAQGMVTPREAILKFLIGEKVLAAQKQDSGQRQRAARNVQRQQAKPTGGRSDVQPTRGRVSEAEARRRRLENAEL